MMEGPDAMCHGLAEALTVPKLIRAGRECWPGNDLVVFDGRAISYEQADSRSARLARRLLEHGVGKGTHVGLVLPNGPEFVVSWLACTRIGAVAVPVSTLSTPPELARTIRHADLQSLIITPRFLNHDYVQKLQEAIPSLQDRSPLFVDEAPFLRYVWVWDEEVPGWARRAEEPEEPAVPEALLAEAEREVSPADRCTMIYTSGSTADPKGVMHSHGGLLRQSLKQARERGYARTDRIFSSMPFFWVGGLSYKLLPAMQAGAAVVGCQSTASRDILSYLEKQRVTVFLGWPHSARALESDPEFASYDLSSMRDGCLFAALPEDRRPPDPELVANALGMTETGGPHTGGYLTPLPEALRGSFGWASPGMEYRVVDLDSGDDVPDGEPGELLLRGDTMMEGQYKRERKDVFRSDGWYATRDIVVRRQGHIFFQGRRDDVVKIKGANVSPKEVESELNAIPGVMQSVVSGITSSGTTVLGAVLVTEPGCELDLDDVRRRMRQRLSSYKVPSVMDTLPIDGLPMMTSGKVDRRALVSRLEEALRSRSGTTRSG